MCGRSTQSIRIATTTIENPGRRSESDAVVLARLANFRYCGMLRASLSAVARLIRQQIEGGD